MSYPFIELSLPCTSAAAQERWWGEMFDAKVLFRGEMMGQAFSRVLVCGVSLVFREDPDYQPPPGPGEELLYRFHLGLRVRALEPAIAELEAKGAQFVLTPAKVRALQKTRQPGGRPFLQTTYIAPPLSRARIDAGEFRHDVAILVAPDNLWVELNEIVEPADTQWYPGAEVKG